MILNKFSASRYFLAGMFCVVHTLASFGQHSLDTLQLAYTQYSDHHFKAACSSFQQYFKSMDGSPKDYYFASICFAQTGLKKEAIEFADKASYGIESYAMMLADNQLEPIHDSIQTRYISLETFYHFYNKRAFIQSQVYPDPYSLYKKLDSLYWSLPARKISQANLISFAETTKGWLKKTKDTAKFIQIIKDLADIPLGGEPNRFHTSKNAIGSIVKNLPSNIQEPLIYRISNRINNPASRLIDNADKGNYRSVTKDLLQIFNLLPDAYEKHLTDPKLKAYYQSTEGQTLIKFWLSLKVIPTILKSNSILAYTSSSLDQLTSESDRYFKYEYSAAKKFNTPIPSEFNVFKYKTKEKLKELYVSRFYYERSLKELHISIKSNTHGLEIMNASPLNGIVLSKRIGKSSFADLPGDFSFQPKENIDFIKEIKEGKKNYYTITNIQENHLRALSTSSVLARLKTLSEGERDVLFYPYELGQEWMAEALVNAPEKVPLIDNNILSSFLNRFEFRHTALVDYTSRFLMHSTYEFAQLSEKEKPLFVLKILSLTKFLPEMFSELPKYKDEISITLKKMRVDNNEAFILFLPVQGEKIASAWKDFKKRNPFTLPISDEKEDEKKDGQKEGTVTEKW